MSNLSLSTEPRAVVEGEPYPNKMDEGSLPADCPIFHVITFLSIAQANFVRVPEVVTLGIA